MLNGILKRTYFLLIASILAFGTTTISCARAFERAALEVKYAENAPWEAYEVTFKVSAMALVKYKALVGIDFVDGILTPIYAEKTIDFAYSGSAFAFKYDKKTRTLYSLTAKHICSMEDPDVIESKIIFMYLTNPSGMIRDAEVVTTAEGADVCLLKTHWEDSNPPPVLADLATNYQKKSTPVYMVGAPYGVYPILTKGTLERWVSHEKDVGPAYILGMTAAPGNSGSPIFNSEGKVVGILVAGYPTTISLAVDSVFVNNWLNEWFKNKS